MDVVFIYKNPINKSYYVSTIFLRLQTGFELFGKQHFSAEMKIQSCFSF